MKILREPHFKRGDIILDLQRKDPRLILSVLENEYYEFLILKDQYWKDIYGNNIGGKKGDTASQPIDIIEKNFSIYEIK